MNWITGSPAWVCQNPVFPPGVHPPSDHSHPAISVDLDACIQCTRCLRACREIQDNDVIGYAGRGDKPRIVFDLEDAMGESSCVACGECVQACPTGALMPANGVGLHAVDNQVDSVCPYCGVGCQMTYHIADNRILFVEGRDGRPTTADSASRGDTVSTMYSHRQRLTKPTDPPRRRPQTGRDGHGLRQSAARFPRGQLARGAGQRRRMDSPAFGIQQGPRPSPALVQPRAPTKRPTCSRSWSAPALAATTSITAPGSAMPLRWRPCLQMIGSGAVSNPVADVMRPR